jgi:hypothetical protein
MFTAMLVFCSVAPVAGDCYQYVDHRRQYPTHQACSAALAALPVGVLGARYFVVGTTFTIRRYCRNDRWALGPANQEA